MNKKTSGSYPWKDDEIKKEEENDEEKTIEGYTNYGYTKDGIEYCSDSEAYE